MTHTQILFLYAAIYMAPHLGEKFGVGLGIFLVVLGTLSWIAE